VPQTLRADPWAPCQLHRSGRNGSGKSTILLAISLCLGAKIPDAREARQGRRRSQAQAHPVVRQGTSTAEVEIELINGACGRSAGWRPCVAPLRRPRRAPPPAAAGEPAKCIPEWGRTVILRRTIKVGPTSANSSTFTILRRDDARRRGQGRAAAAARGEGAHCPRTRSLSHYVQRSIAPPATLRTRRRRIRSTFNLRADNPLIILDQETSKVFATISPKSAPRVKRGAQAAAGSRQHSYPCLQSSTSTSCARRSCSRTTRCSWT